MARYNIELSCDRAESNCAQSSMNDSSKARLNMTTFIQLGINYDTLTHKIHCIKIRPVVFKL